MRISDFMERGMRPSMSNYIDAVPAHELLKDWKLEELVFNADEARKERKLNQVMILPSWFFEVLGNINNTDYVVVTGQRGSGKSAIRRSIADHCVSETGNSILGGSVMCISIDHDSTNWIRSYIENPKRSPVDYFCDEIVEKMIIAILTYREPQEIKDALSSRDFMLLERYLRILEKKHPDEIRELSSKILSSYKRVMDNDTVKTWISAITMFFKNEVTFATEEPVITPSINDIQSIINIVKKCGFDAVYVLVDEIDEYDETTGKPDFASEIIVPILSSINLLEKESIGFKFFIAAPVFSRLKSTSKKLNMEIRHDRTRPKPYVLEWSNSDIEKMYRLRLMTYSNGKIDSLQTFCADDLTNIDSTIVKFSYKNPRHMIRLCDTIIRYTARSANATDYKINSDVFIAALFEFCEATCSDAYPEKEHYIQAIIQNDEKIILASKFAKDNDIDIDKANTILSEMTGLGALKMQKKLSGETEYMIIDPKIIHLKENKRMDMNLE